MALYATLRRATDPGVRCAMPGRRSARVRIPRQQRRRGVLVQRWFVCGQARQ
jgi:hypothetical protein